MPSTCVPEEGRERAHRGSPRHRLKTFIALAILGLPSVSRADEPARPTSSLLKLVPADASVVLTVDDLRGQTREFLASRLVEEFQKLPAVKAWFDSEKYEELEQARDQIEAVLQVSLTEIRDKVLGDAVVFALRLPADVPFDPAKCTRNPAAQGRRSRALAADHRDHQHDPEAERRSRFGR